MAHPGDPVRARRRALLAACAAVLSAWSAGLILLCCRQGIGFAGDTGVYFKVARDLWTHPLPAFHAPLYPVLLGVMLPCVPGMDAAALTLNVAAGAVAIPAVFLLLAAGCELPVVPALLAAVLLLFSYPALLNFTCAMTEAPFIAFTTLSVLFLALHLRQCRLAPLVAAACLAALAALTRYIGVSLSLAGGAAILLAARGTGKPLRALGRALLFGAVSVTPLLLWMAANRLRSGSATSHFLVEHDIGFHVSQGVATILEWVMPYRVFASWSDPLRLLALAAMLAALLVMAWRTRSEDRGEALFLVLYSAAYLGMALLSVKFSDKQIPFNNRILGPMAFSLVPLVVAVGYRVQRASGRRVVSRLAGLAGLLALALYGYRGAGACATFARDGIEGNRVVWRNSPTLAYVREVQGKVPIYSNDPNAVYLQAGLDVRWVPFKLHMMTRRPNPAYAEGLKELGEAARTEGAVVAFFRLRHHTDADVPDYLPAPAEIMEGAGLVVIRELPDGLILGAPER